MIEVQAGHGMAGGLERRRNIGESERKHVLENPPDRPVWSRGAMTSTFIYVDFPKKTARNISMDSFAPARSLSARSFANQRHFIPTSYRMGIQAVVAAFAGRVGRRLMNARHIFRSVVEERYFYPHGCDGKQQKNRPGEAKPKARCHEETAAAMPAISNNVEK